jgi:hypothetical protein
MIQACSAGQDVVVAGPDQSGLPGHLINGADAATAQAQGATGHLAMNVARRKHGIGAWRTFAAGQSSGNPPLAAEHFLWCGIAHWKRLLAYGVVGIRYPPYTREFRRFEYFYANGLKKSAESTPD